MDASSIVLGGGQRKRLMALYRGKEAHPQAQVRLRAHIILLPADGHAWSLVAAAPFCSTATIARRQRRFEAGGVEALAAAEGTRGRAAVLSAASAPWSWLVSWWVRRLTPRDFGFPRGRRSCLTLSLPPWGRNRLRASARRRCGGCRCAGTSSGGGGGRGRCPGPKDPQAPWKRRRVRELPRDPPGRRGGGVRGRARSA